MLASGILLRSGTMTKLWVFLQLMFLIKVAASTEGSCETGRLHALFPNFGRCYSIVCNNVSQNSIHPFCSPAAVFIMSYRRSDSLEIEAGAFEEFSNLRELYMEDSSVENMEPGAFNGLVNLKRLSLSKNKLAHLRKGIFNSLTTLSYLDMSNNFIQSFEKDTFLGMKDLKTLGLENNRIKNIEQILNVRNNLTVLRLQYNDISDLTSLHKFEHLEDLNLANNLITELPEGVFGSTDLKLLMLSSNLIRNINENAFMILINLKTLDLSSNTLLVRIPVGLFRNNKNLQILNLSGSGLETISIGTFTGLHSLKDLYLSFNRLTYLPKGVFDDLKLTSLHINGNSLTYLDYGGDLSTTMPIAINLNDNPWRCDVLANIIRTLEGANIIRGYTTKTSNIYGITCSEHQYEKILKRRELEEEIEEDYNKIRKLAAIEYSKMSAEIKSDVMSIKNEFLNTFQGYFNYIQNNRRYNCSVI
ncbi:hypothetical protein Trydic_g3373 [Trypoxylus dichotomus]